ncbi:MAG TPA: ABC transporter ATP-binding protein, partial [Vicinamibacterales bacterium]|nr:ABC transporter ATP-binding protein [Vicinamibacterales bacterium]
RGLRKSFGETLAVDDLSLTVDAGEIFGFLGPNGAGKTTSIKMLLALVTPDEGDGEVLGEPIGSRAARARVGFLPEHCRFHDSLTARELVRFHGRLHGMRGQALETRIDQLLSRVDMLDAADRPLRGYSKGMLQRAGLAQALVNDPKLVFLDEPTSGLDPLGRLLVRDILGELRSNGVSVFLNSHLLGEVEATCDRVAFVKQGRVVHQLALGAAPSSFEIEIRAVPIGPAVLEGLARFGTVAGRPGEDRVLLRVAADDVLPDVSRWLVGQGLRLYELRGWRKSLEEWFVDVMGEDQRPG